MQKYYTIIGLIIILVSCKNEQRLNDNPVTIEATFMQYACGDWNDDMKINSINDSSLNYLIGTDIDPEIIQGEKEIRGLLYDNGFKNLYKYRLTGYISESAKYGCENCTPKFWIEKIEKLNGDKFDLNDEN